MIWCGVNGIGLALVIPCVQSLTADYNPADLRGRAFGIMSFTAAMGKFDPEISSSFKS